MRDVIVLGSTGSIGQQTLDVIAASPEAFRVVGLSTGGSDLAKIAQQAHQFKPRVVALANADRAGELRTMLPAGVELIAGPDASVQLASDACDVCVNAITGAAGLLPTLATLKTGTTLALANKESLVIGGKLVTSLAADGQIAAVDSEHSALAQSLRSGNPKEVKRLILTASGGPFRGRTRAELATVTPEQAMVHPTWNMGRVITINSATLVNKGLELIEASLLFDVALSAIDVVVHPQSIVHSMVEFVDGSTIAQASPPDMRLPIGLALTWPERMSGLVAPCDWTSAATWEFEPYDDEVFPALSIARAAGELGGTAPAVFNAANEVCVDAFCERRLGFLDISDIIEQTLAKHSADFVADSSLSVDAVLNADRSARRIAAHLIESTK